MAAESYASPKKCEWTANASNLSPCPHSHNEYRKGEPKILNSVLERIGNTPMVRLDRLMKSEGLECELLAKCEYFNAGGSIKDRIGYRMFEDAERSGRIKPGDTIIEVCFSYSFNLSYLFLNVHYCYLIYLILIIIILIYHSQHLETLELDWRCVQL